MLIASPTIHTFALRKGLSTVCAFVLATVAGLPSAASAAPPGASAAQTTGRSEGPPRGGYAPRRQVVPRGRYYSGPRRYSAPRYAPRYAPRGYGYRYAPAYRPRVVYRTPGPYWRPGPPFYVVQPQPVVVVEPAPAPYIVEGAPQYQVAPHETAPPVGCEEPQDAPTPPPAYDGYEGGQYDDEEESGDYDTDYQEAPEPAGRPTPSGQPEITRQWEARQAPRPEAPHSVAPRTEAPQAELRAAPSEGDAGEVTLDQIEDEIVRLTNAERARAGLVPVAAEARLMETARRHSEEMGQLGYFSHESPTAGRTGTVDRLRQEGVTGYQRASENIAMGTFDATSAARELVEMWMKSPGHRKNILDPDVFLIGVGAAQNEKGEIIATQVFTAVAEPALPDMPVGGRPAGTTDL